MIRSPRQPPTDVASAGNKQSSTPHAAVCSIRSDQVVAVQPPGRPVRRAAAHRHAAGTRVVQMVNARVEADRGAADAVQQQRQQAALREVGDGLRADARVQSAALPLNGRPANTHGFAPAGKLSVRAALEQLRWPLTETVVMTLTDGDW